MNSARLFQMWMKKYNILYDRYLIELNRQSNRASIAATIIGCYGVLVSVSATILVSVLAGHYSAYVTFIPTFLLNHLVVLILILILFSLIIRFLHRVFKNIYPGDNDVELLHPAYLYEMDLAVDVKILCELLLDTTIKYNKENSFKEKSLTLNTVFLFICTVFLFVIIFCTVLCMCPQFNFNFHILNLSNTSYSSDKALNLSNNRINISANNDKLIYLLDPIFNFSYNRTHALGVQNHVH